MSDQVDLKQVREVANKPIVPLEQVWRDMLNQMADEIERLREFKEYADTYHNGIYEQFEDWRKR